MLSFKAINVRFTHFLITHQLKNATKERKTNNLSNLHIELLKMFEFGTLSINKGNWNLLSTRYLVSPWQNKQVLPSE